MRYLILFITICCFASNAVAQEPQIQILNIEHYKEAISSNDIQLVDVRTSEEFVTGHIANAVNIDYFQKRLFLKGLDKLDKKQPLFLYCRSGGRSQKAAKIAIKNGFIVVYDLEGGYLNWKSEE